MGGWVDGWMDGLVGIGIHDVSVAGWWMGWEDGCMDRRVE